MTRLGCYAFMNDDVTASRQKLRTHVSISPSHRVFRYRGAFK